MTNPLQPQEDLSKMVDGELIDAAAGIRERRDQFTALAKEEDKLLDLYLAEIDRRMRDDKSTLKGGHRYKAVVTEQENWGITDWSAFYTWLYENEAGYMLNRAPNQASFKEAARSGMEIPGAAPFRKRKISLTKIPTKS